MTTTAAAMAEMEYVTAKTSVWWDIENCEVPRGYDSYAIAQNVSSALLKMKYCGPVSITAYGDTNLIPLNVQQALSSTGVGLNHVPAGVKDASDKKILVDMLLWAIDNPAPANFMLISGDRDFSYALHQLRMRRYNILLAQPLQASVLDSLALDSHLRGKKHASMLSQPEAIIDSKKWQEIGVSQNDQPKETIVSQKEQLKETIAEPKATTEHICCLCNVTCPSQIVFDSHLRGQKHAAMLSQSEALDNTRKLGEKVVEEKAEPIETVAENKSQSQNTQETTKFFEKQNEEFRDTSESSIKELCLSRKEGVETDNKQLPNGDFFFGDLRCDTEVPREARESFVGIVKPVNLSEGADENLEEVKVRRKASGLCCFCIVICDHQGLSTVVCGNKCHWTNQKHTKVSASVAINDSQSSISTKPIKEAEVLEPVWCQVCGIGCLSKDAYKNHTYGKRHRNNLDLQSDKSNNISVGPVVPPRDFLEKQKMKVNDNRAYPNANHVCLLCNVVCQSQVVFDSHLRGKKHASMLSPPEALIDSNKPQEGSVCQKDQPKETIVSQREQLHLDQTLIDSKMLQEKGVGKEDQTRETIAEPKPKAEHVCRMCNVACHSPIVFASHLRGKKHVAMLSQSNALIDSRKLQEKGVEENDQPSKKIAHLQLQSQNAQENSMCFEKHVVMVNQSEALNNSMKLEETVVQEKAQPRETVAENQSLSQNTQENINFSEKQNGELREICGASESNIKEMENTVNKQLPNGELVFGDLRCGFDVPNNSICLDGIAKPAYTSKQATQHSGEVLVKDQAEMAFVDSRRTGEESDLEKSREALEQAFFVDVKKIQEVRGQEKEITEEHALVKIDDLGFQDGQEDEEEVKEINAISEKLAHVFTEPNRESRIRKESRGCLDVIPERLQLPPTFNVTEILKEESKLTPLEPGSESAGRKEHPREAVKREEEINGQVDNFWTRLWGKKR